MKKILFPLMALALVLGLSLSVVGPADAQVTANSVDIFLGVDETYTHSDGSLHYTITLQNANIPGAHNATVNVTFCPPDNTGALGSYGPCVPIATGVFIEVGESICYNYDGSGGCIAASALEVDLGAIPLDPGVAIVYAQAEYDAVYDYDPVYTASGTKNIPVAITEPEISIEKTVDFNGDGVYTEDETNSAGETASWKIVVCNIGDAPVYDILITDTNGESHGPFDLLNNGDCEEFVYDMVMNVNTVNTACAEGVDERGLVVGPVCDSAQVRIPSHHVPTLSQWGMIGMAILFAALLIWSVRRKWLVSASIR